MKKNTKGTSLIEAMIVMMIVTVGVVGMYNIFGNSVKLSDSTSNRLQAISIAREGLEAMMNIRDTNWILFASNTEGCRNTLNYERNCIISTNDSTDISSGSYIIYKNNDNRWTLSGVTILGDYSNTNYRNNFSVRLDNDGFYTQSGSSNFKPLYTREIKINYPDGLGSSTGAMNIESIVNWADSSKTGFFTVKLNTTLTNWKK